MQVPVPKTIPAYKTLKQPFFNTKIMIIKNYLIVISLILLLLIPTMFLNHNKATYNPSNHSHPLEAKVSITTNTFLTKPNHFILPSYSRESVVSISSLAFSITSNSDLYVYSSSGNGSSTNPYIIQNRVVTSTISISNTNDYFILRNITVTNADTGIDLQNVTHGMFTNLNVSFNNMGVKSVNSFNNTFSFNFLKNNQQATFYIIGSNNNSFIDNVLYQPSPNYPDIIQVTHYGIYLQNSTNNIIIGNNFTNTGIIQVSELVSLAIQSIVENNTVNGKPLLYIQNIHDKTISDPVYGQILLINSSDITIKNQQFSNTTFGIEISFCSNILFSDSTIFNSSFGIISTVSNEISFINNSVFSTLYGIYIDQVNDSRMLSNFVYENYYGIELFSSNSIEIGSNFIKNNTYTGIYTSYLLLSNISFNLFTTNSNGLYMRLSNFNSISSNEITNNSASGIVFFSECLNNTIYFNNFTLNRGIGLSFFNDTAINSKLSSKNNLVYLNSFIANNNGNNVVTQSKYNFFDNGTFGNYWDTYKGTDSNNDGIGDTPAYVAYNQYDYFPLMHQPIKGKAIKITPLQSSSISSLTATITKTYSIDNFLLFSVIISFGLAIICFGLVFFLRKKRKG